MGNPAFGYRRITSPPQSKMSRWIIPFIVGFLIGGPVMVGALHLFWGESPQQAYERGYVNGRSAFSDTLYNRWLNDSLDWGLSLNVKNDIKLHSTELETSVDWHSSGISEALARSWYYGTDSTDTLPAVDPATTKEE